MPKILSGEDIDAVRAKIGGAASRLYAKGGPAAITMRDLAEATGRSPMGLYRYFSDRDEIIAWLRTDAFNRFSDALEEAFASGRDAFARARAVGQAYLDFALKKSDAYRLMFDMSQPDDTRYPDLIAAGIGAREQDRHAPCHHACRCRRGSR